MSSGIDGWKTQFLDLWSMGVPRYFFHVRDGVDRPDREGTDLPGIEAARAEALVLAGETIRNAGMRADLGEKWRITVTDDEGLMLFVMDFLVAETPPRAVGDRSTDRLR